MRLAKHSYTCSEVEKLVRDWGRVVTQNNSLSKGRVPMEGCKSIYMEGGALHSSLAIAKIPF